ncbi:hypothetical protein BDR06DRAFT_1022663 [Suillus hirtellus]|nr:hypothetical protein BDR06DRAFT_1022663 [Suillus hirtellus]
MSPAGETDTSSTPPRTNALSQCGTKIESTPNSRGASVVSENISLVDVQAKEVQPWVQWDIEQAKQCKADAILQTLLQRASCAPETKQPELLPKCLKVVLPVCNGQVSAGGMSSFVRSGIGNDFYSPFIDATNIALACLAEIKIDGMRAPVSTVDMICQKNDMPMYQTYQTVISPDVIILPLNITFEDEKRKQKDDEKHDTKRKAHMVKNAKEKLPASLPWKYFLACIEFLWHYTFTNPTSAIREALDHPEPTIGSRVLCVLVFRKLKPITELHDHELFDAWYQCISCHLTLWKEGVYHRDVSPGNMMWYKKNSKLIGVLIDYDLSALADDLRPRGNQCTGTVPFMALDLLTAKAQRGDVKHLYRHDLESFVWVFTWISFRYDNGALLPARLRPIDQWAILDAVSCGKEKQSFVNYLEDFRPLHIKTVIWCFILACFQVLDIEAFNRRKRWRGMLIQADGSDEEINDVDEGSVSDVDDLLGKFTGNIAWVKLSNASRSQ